MWFIIGCPMLNFYPRSPCGERPFEKFEGIMVTKISIHALLAESDTASAFWMGSKSQFLSTLSLRRATKLLSISIFIHAFLSTLSLRRATASPFSIFWICLSIHALLAESDGISSIRIIGFSGFLSTLSLRRATAEARSLLLRARPFYPRSPCGERHDRGVNLFGFEPFYPRSPCGERHGQSITLRLVILFLSTLSLRRATNINSSVTTADKLSIHALLAESDRLLMYF